ncbi:hypothetical protein LCGC14_2447160, partial [marine sediment metagenome]
TGLGTLSGVVFPFAASVAVSGETARGMTLPVAAAGDNFLSKTQELRIVARDGSITLIAPSAVVVEMDDIALSEENQSVVAVTFQLFRATISGTESPYLLVSGSHPTTDFGI